MVSTGISVVKYRNPNLKIAICFGFIFWTWASISSVFPAECHSRKGEWSWSDPGAWSGTIPSEPDTVVIKSGSIITIKEQDVACGYQILVEPGATLIQKPGSCIILQTKDKAKLTVQGTYIADGSPDAPATICSQPSAMQTGAVEFGFRFGPSNSKVDIRYLRLNHLKQKGDIALCFGLKVGISRCEYLSIDNYGNCALASWTSYTNFHHINIGQTGKWTVQARGATLAFRDSVFDPTRIYLAPPGNILLFHTVLNAPACDIYASDMTITLDNALIFKGQQLRLQTGILSLATPFPAVSLATLPGTSVNVLDERFLSEKAKIGGGGTVTIRPAHMSYLGRHCTFKKRSDSPNLIMNSSFECGSSSWGAFSEGDMGFRVGHLLGAPDNSTAAFGEYSFKCFSLTGQPFYVNMQELNDGGRGYLAPANKPMYANMFGPASYLFPEETGPYTLSAYLNTDTPGFRAYFGNRLFNLETGWHRYTSTITLKAGERNSFPFSINRQNTNTIGNVWIDAVQLEKGAAATDYQPNNNLEIGVSSERYGNIFFEHLDKPNLTVWLHNGLNQSRTVNIRVRLYDFSDQLAKEFHTRVHLPERGNKQIQVPLKVPRGYYRVLLRVWDDYAQATHETRLALVQKLPETMDPQAPLASCHSILSYCNKLDMAKQAGVSLVRHWSWSWQGIEPLKGRFEFETIDAQLEFLEQGGMEVLACMPVLTSWWSSSAPESLKKTVSIDPKTGYTTMPWGQCGKLEELSWYPPKDINDWTHFLETTMERYKGRVRYWQLGNEGGFRQDYIPLWRAARKVATATGAKLIDGSGTPLLPTNLDDFDRVCRQGFLEFFDALDVHAYYWGESSGEAGSLAETLRYRLAAAQSIMARYGRVLPIWNTEYISLGYFGRKTDWPAFLWDSRYQRDEKEQAEYDFRVIMTGLASGVQRFMPCLGPGHHAYTSPEITATSYECFHQHGGYPTPLFVSWNVLAAHLRDMRILRNMALEPETYCYPFVGQKDPFCVLYFTGISQEAPVLDTAKLGRNVDLISFMGTPIKTPKIKLDASRYSWIYSLLARIHFKTPKIKLDASPIYVHARGLSLEQLQKRIRAAYIPCLRKGLAGSLTITSSNQLIVSLRNQLSTPVKVDTVQFHGPYGYGFKGGIENVILPPAACTNFTVLFNPSIYAGPLFAVVSGSGRSFMLETGEIMNALKSTPIIDGKLDEWSDSGAFFINGPSIISANNAWKDASDLSVLGYGKWDKRCLYFALQVAGKKYDPQQDYVRLALQVQPANAAPDLDCIFMDQSVRIIHSSSPNSGTLTNMIRFAVQRTATSAVYEIAIPAECLRFTPEHGQILRADCLVNNASGSAAWGHGLVGPTVNSQVFNYMVLQDPGKQHEPQSAADHVSCFTPFYSVKPGVTLSLSALNLSLQDKSLDSYFIQVLLDAKCVDAIDRGWNTALRVLQTKDGATALLVWGHGSQVSSIIFQDDAGRFMVVAPEGATIPFKRQTGNQLVVGVGNTPFCVLLPGIAVDKVRDIIRHIGGYGEQF